MLIPDYRSAYAASLLTTDKGKLNELDSICKVIGTNELIYRSVALAVSIPWVLIGAIHFREASLNFRRHLHNGDPLTGRTIRVPSGRPFEGNPPFTWIESATDALKGAWTPEVWSLPNALEFLERYNGLGYRMHDVLSPYLWNYTDKYLSGLYVSDGNFDPNKIEQRAGCVAILKTLESKGAPLGFTESPRDSGLH